MTSKFITELDDESIEELFFYSTELNKQNEDKIKKLFMKKTQIKLFRGKRTLLIAAVLVSLLILISGISLTVHLSRAGDVIADFGFSELSAVFNGTDALDINETQIAGDYKVKLMAIATGKDIVDDKLNDAGGGVSGTGIYALFTIERIDGNPMRTLADLDPSITFEDGIDTLDYFHFSPYIGGYHPAKIDDVTLVNFGAIMVIDGIMYILIECDELYVFADHGIYIGATAGFFPKSDAFLLNHVTDEIYINPHFDGVAVIFNLPFAKSLADPEKVRIILEGTD